MFKKKVVLLAHPCNFVLRFNKNNKIFKKYKPRNEKNLQDRHFAKNK